LLKIHVTPRQGEEFRGSKSRNVGRSNSSIGS
jgi:hypothetical protein